MPLLIDCSACRRPLYIAETNLGQTVKCPRCSATFVAQPRSALATVGAAPAASSSMSPVTKQPVPSDYGPGRETVAERDVTANSVPETTGTAVASAAGVARATAIRVRLERGSQPLVLASRPLAQGGEAAIYEVPGQPTLVAKVYHQATAEHAGKLAAMLANPPVDPMAARGAVSIAWPLDRLWSADGPERCLGFVMPRVNHVRPLFEIYNPKTRLEHSPLFHYGYLLRTARNLAVAVGAVHERGYVIGDLNESNLLVNNMALVTLVDTDSFQVRHQGRVYRCPVGKPEYSPPELQQARFADFDRGPEQDAFALAVLIFQLLMQGIHPFAGRFTGQDEPASLEDRIAAGHWPYARSRPVPYAPNPHAPPFGVLPPPVQKLLRRCFEDGHVRSSVRPNAADWFQALQQAEQEMMPCPANSQHVYHRGLSACPWCRFAGLRQRDPFPARADSQTGRAASSPSRPQPVLPPSAPFAAPNATPPPLTPSSARPELAPIRLAAEVRPVPLSVPVAAPAPPLLMAEFVPDTDLDSEPVLASAVSMPASLPSPPVRTRHILDEGDGNKGPRSWPDSHPDAGSGRPGPAPGRAGPSWPVYLAAASVAVLLVAVLVLVLLPSGDTPPSEHRATVERPTDRQEALNNRSRPTAVQPPAVPVNKAPVVQQPNQANQAVQRPNQAVQPPVVQPPVRPRPRPNPRPFQPVQPPPPKENGPFWAVPALEIRRTLQPPVLNGTRVVVQLPAQVADVAVGGGGRYLILYLRRLSKLAIFDVNRAQVVRYLSMEDGVKFAAGIDKLVVALPKAGRLERYDLATGQREITSDGATGVSALCMGSASHGPLLVCRAPEPSWRQPGAAWFLDVQTFQRVRPFTTKRVPGDGAFIRASADGTVFTMRNGVGGEPHTVTAISFQSVRTDIRSVWGFPSSVLVPGPNGKFLYSGWAVYTSELKLVHPNPVPTHSGKPFLPAAHGGFVMRLDYKQWDQLGGQLAFFLEGHNQPFARLDNVEGVTNERISYGKLRDTLCYDQRVHFLPEANLIISIPATNDRLVLTHFDVEKALAESGKDYLYVTSHPPVLASRGQTWTYTPVVKSSKGGVQLKLDAGPLGMRLSKKGALSWRVGRASGGWCNVILSVKDAGGNRCLHTFTIRLAG